jgi:sugar phosphate isomerase/epimerase
MKLSQVAAQLYTVREHCQTAAALAATAKKIRAIGYPAVQLSALGPIPEDEIVAIMRDAGLTICATHEPAQEILGQPEACIARLQRLGCRLTAYPWPHGVDFASAEQIRTLARQLDAAGAKFRAAGITLGYHNHAIEFVPFEGAPVLDYLYAHTRPENLAAELDTFWIHYGGGDVIEWIEKLRGRLPFIHLKDYGFTIENKHMWCEIGRGTFNWQRIIAAAGRSGCEWFIVEQDTCPGDPFESLKISFDYLAANFTGG